MWNGFPIPYNTIINDGVPDFRTLNEMRTRICFHNRVCAICGQAIPEGWLALIGGENSIQNRLFIDPAMHRECAYYAAQVCPFLAGTKRQYAEGISKTQKSDTVDALTMIDQPRPKKMAIYETLRYTILEDRGTLLCRADKKPCRIDWNIMPESI